MKMVRTRRLELPRDLTPTRPSTWRVYQFRHVRWSDLAGARTQDPLLKREMLYQLSYQVNKRDLAGARTQDPLLKREMLYQLSYQVFRGSKYNINYLYFKSNCYKFTTL